MSGLPGSFLFFGPLIVKRNPIRWSIERTSFSGRVFFPRMRDITQDRLASLKTSGTMLHKSPTAIRGKREKASAEYLSDFLNEIEVGTYLRHGSRQLMGH